MSTTPTPPRPSPRGQLIAGVVGTGFIGMSWAIVFTRAGLETRVYDSDEARQSSLPARFERSLAVLVGQGALTADQAAEMQGRLHTVGSIAELADGVGYVQECVREELDLKRSVLQQLDRAAPASAVLGSSASTIPMTQIATGFARPERCVVVHPTNPPHLVPLVEVVPGEATAPDVTDFTVAFMERLGQVPIRCEKEIWGFVLNRLQFALMREALFLVDEGVASVGDIDRCVSEGLGLRWALLGPFGVCHTNAEDIRAGLDMYANQDRQLFDDLCRPFKPLAGKEVIERLSEDVDAYYADRDHATLIDWRDQMLVELRRLKEGDRTAGGLTS